ncbi:excinuclease ABC subunit UvrA [Planomicrobium sp. CPCC 101079]|uniref:excinuclease ABC subunit UvrA n=1 Tax=Planomicrobium sp. CPCC 101079 TaxID=2599618 RepID=UPI0011B4EBF6|nr:excinuclease ABC subunit UvrA [Planomicrobium sp. CPCC 101079]TWT13226.1 excinuclease ABC subunit A [Planomicrobium sp. CPCC 101079]
MNQFIRITNATENNLKNVSVDIPKNRFVVITGPSGSGKSTLALDILQRESQRQYMEANGIISSLINKPKVGSVLGLSPSIGVGQQVTNRNPRSTVGTVTDMYTYMRVLYEKLGERECPNCRAIVTQSMATDELSETVACGNCGHELENLTRAHFSFNTLEGACPICSGLGKTVDIHRDQVFNSELSLKDGAVTFWFPAVREYYGKIVETGAKYYGFDLDMTVPLKDYNEVQRDFLYYGAESEEFKRHYPDKQPPKTVSQGRFEGVLTGLWRRYKENGGNSVESKFFFSHTCSECGGEKLKKESRLAKVAGCSITEVSKWPLEEVMNWIKKLNRQAEETKDSLTAMILEDLTAKIIRIVNVGLAYLSMDREAVTLSGGESQRLRLATILGSGLTGVLYILDEPTAGLHPRDTLGLVKIIKQLRDIGNTVLVIEHDVSVMEQADHIIDLGPGAGTSGGEVVGEGTLLDLQEQPRSVTGAFVKEFHAAPANRRPGTGQHLTVYNAHKNNLKNITASFPLGCFVTVTGVSGSGKSSLLFDIVAASSLEENGKEGYDQITGLEVVDKMVTVDQSALSRMQRSNVATYTEVFTLLRTLFAKLPASVENGLSSKHFSFNTEGGRCENCQGLGYVLTKMYFLPDIEVECPVCRGKRFKEEVLAVTYQGYSISGILDLSIEESLALFVGQKKITAIIGLLCEVGLGYLKWGQTLTTLSGGEGQRLKLARELSKPAKGHTLYILDEPSTGLHPNDVKTLLLLINKLVDAGNTVIIVEHNTDIIRASDWVIDLGPEGGEAGGYLVAEGTPEQVAGNGASYTGAYLGY